MSVATSAPRIVAVEIFPAHKWGDEARISVKLDGTTEYTHLFAYFSDEIRFKEEELRGLTVEEAWALKQKKDLAYLRS